MRSKWRGLAPTSDFHGFKLLLPGLLSSCGEGCVFTVKFQLPTPPCPIFGLADTLFRAVEQVDLVQSGSFAQLHDLDTEVPHGLGGAGVLHTLTPVAGLLHIGFALHFSCSDAADHDVDMDVSRMVVPIGVSADDGGMTGEIFLAELQAKGLRPFHGQAVLYCVLWVEADDIMVGLHVLPPAVLVVFAIGNQAGHSKRRFAALKGVEQVRIPQLGSALLVQNGQTSVLVVLKGEIAFGGGVVRVLRA